MGFIKSVISTAKFVAGVAKLAKDGGSYNTGVNPKESKKTEQSGWAPKTQSPAPAEREQAPDKSGWGAKK